MDLTKPTDSNQSMQMALIEIRAIANSLSEALDAEKYDEVRIGLLHISCIANKFNCCFPVEYRIN